MLPLFAASRDPGELEKFMQTHLNQAATLGRNLAARHVQQFECLRYNSELGIRFQVVQAFAFPGALHPF